MAFSTYQAASSSSSSFTRRKYDVFLSFRGEDTHFGFTGHLYEALCEKGLNTFIHNYLQRGEEIPAELLKVIDDSTILIIVFSENYAFSSWCLDELVKIIECLKNDQVVLPIFYKVDPSEVRQQKGKFGEALTKHEIKCRDIKKVQRWKNALKEAGSLSGFRCKEDGCSEYKFIQEILEFIGRTITKQMPLFSAKYLVGIDSHVEAIKLILDIESNDVRMVVIYGSAGVGKTTIAKAVYKNIFKHFEQSSFLENVSKKSQTNGVIQLQETLLFQISGDSNIKIHNVSKGITMIKEVLFHSKILLILDDVDKLDQIEKLLGKCDWFASGTRIIITTRDKYLLDSLVNVDLSYKVKELDDYRALELFSWHAFRRDDTPKEDYLELSEQVIVYAKGHPLALTIMGASFCGRTKQEWENALDKYKRIPKLEIQEILKLSYEALDTNEQKIFLQVACSLNGMRVTVEDIVKTVGSDIVGGIKKLIDKCLITVDQFGTLWMHDLLQQMGQEIVRQESPQMLKDCSRVLIKDTMTTSSAAPSFQRAIDILYEATNADKRGELKLAFELYAEAFEGLKKNLQPYYESAALVKKKLNLESTTTHTAEFALGLADSPPKLCPVKTSDVKLNDVGGLKVCKEVLREATIWPPSLRCSYEWSDDSTRSGHLLSTLKTYQSDIKKTTSSTAPSLQRVIVILSEATRAHRQSELKRADDLYTEAFEEFKKNLQPYYIRAALIKEKLNLESTTTHTAEFALGPADSPPKLCPVKTSDVKLNDAGRLEVCKEVLREDSIWPPCPRCSYEWSDDGTRSGHLLSTLKTYQSDVKRDKDASWRFIPTDEELVNHYLGRNSEVQVSAHYDKKGNRPLFLDGSRERKMANLSLESLPLGFRFSPTDEELVNHYLRLKNEGRNSEVQVIAEVDFYKFDPWELPDLSAIELGNEQRFFFCELQNASRLNRITKSGYWKVTGKDRPIKSGKSRPSNSSLIGSKKTLFYHTGRAPNGVRTSWVVHEYRAIDTHQGGFILCRLFNNDWPPTSHRIGSFMSEETSLDKRVWGRSGDLDLTGPPRGMVFDTDAVEMTSNSSKQTKSEIEVIEDEASQRWPEGLQVEEMQQEAISTLKPQGVFDVEAIKMPESSGQMKFQIADKEMEPEADQPQESQQFLMQVGLRLTEPPKDEDWENANEIYLMDNELSVLPENPRCPKLSALFLQRNYKLRLIPPSFFDYMPALQTLNLSGTNIKSLPNSIVRLVSLKRLFLNDCHCFMVLSPKIGELKQLEVLSLEGTEIMDLPLDIKKLTNLTCLEVSFCEFQSNCRQAMQLNAVVPCGVISVLSQLEELDINVDPDDERWDACVEDIVNEVCTLKRLYSLKFYFQRVELLSHVQWNIPSLLYFRFIVGRHVKRIMSGVPRDVEFELEQWDRCLKYINGVDVPRDIKKVLQHATAFFLDRHATVKKLSNFGIQNMEKLKCLVMGECSEVQVIIDEADGYEEDDSDEMVSGSYGTEKIVLGSLEYMYVYYMESLRSMWEGPGPLQPESLFCLKSLTLCTCPQLTTIFTPGLLANLCNLEELKVDDCPSIKSIVSHDITAEHKISYFLPELKKISLHYMPELVSISNGLHIAPKLEWLSFYACPNLKNPLVGEVSIQCLKKIKGETSWWEALEWSNGRPGYLDEIFVPIDIWDC